MIVSLLGKFYNIPFRSILYPLWVAVPKESFCLATRLRTLGLLERTLCVNALEIEKYLGHRESLNFKVDMNCAQKTTM